MRLPCISLLCLLTVTLTALPAVAQDGGPDPSLDVQKTAGGAGAAREPEPSESRRIVLWAFGGGAVLFFALFIVQLLVRGDAPQIVSHWGGFGGGVGGWHLSPSAAFLLAALVLSGLVAVVTVKLGDQETAKKGDTATTTPATTTAAAPASPAPNPTTPPATQ